MEAEFYQQDSSSVELIWLVNVWLCDCGQQIVLRGQTLPSW